MTKSSKPGWTLSSTEVIALLSMLYSSPIAFAPIRMFTVAGESAWIAGLVSAVFGALIVVIWVAVCINFPKRELPEIVQSVLGPHIGSLFNLIFALYFLYEAAVAGRIIGEVMLRVLPGTPMVVILSMALFIGVVIARLGPEVMGRLASMHLWIVSAAFAVVVASLTKDLTPSYYLPVITGGVGPVLNAAITPTALLGHVIVISLLLPHMRGVMEAERDQGERWREGLRVGMLGMGITWLFFMIMLTFEQGIFSAEQAARLTIPALSLVRAIKIGAFFERIEVSLVGVWLPAAFLKLSLFLYGTSVFTKHLARTPERRRYVLALAALIVPVTLGIAENVPEFIVFVNGAWPLFQLVVKVAIPLLLLGLLLVKRRLSHAQ